MKYKDVEYFDASLLEAGTEDVPASVFDGDTETLEFQDSSVTLKAAYSNEKDSVYASTQQCNQYNDSAVILGGVVLCTILVGIGVYIILRRLKKNGK